MFTRPALASFTREITVASRGLSGEAVSRAIATKARQHIAQVERDATARSGGIEPGKVTIVDGRKTDALETVKPSGAIIIQWDYMTEAANRVVQFLTRNGPERSGDWKKAITIYVDDTPHPRRQPIPVGAQEVVVAVPIIYARKLEVGRDKEGGPFTVEVPRQFITEHALAALKPALRKLGFDARAAWVQHATGKGIPLARRSSDSRRARAERSDAMRFPGIAIRRKSGPL
jgi:hypothetical protein